MNYNLYDIVETKGGVGPSGVRGIIVELKSPMLYGRTNGSVFLDSYEKKFGQNFAVRKTDYATLALSKKIRMTTFEEYCSQNNIETSEVYRAIYERDIPEAWACVHPTFDLRYVTSITKEEYHSIIFNEDGAAKDESEIYENIEKVFSSE